MLPGPFSTCQRERVGPFVELPDHLLCLVPGGHRLNGQSRLERHLAGYESSSTLLTSEPETTSLCDSDDDDTMSR